ncbi:MAG: TylF/MycF/NovP-related O-methyltransferase [Candidatus Saccharimonadales bacterium]
MSGDLQIDMVQRELILTELEKALEADGDVVELGCYMGETSVQMGRLMRKLGAQKKLWLYDSFEGLPEKSGADASAIGVNFKAGELKASKAEVMMKFKKAGLNLPIVKKGWFDELEPSRDLPEKICFALLDGDYYDSIKVSLGLVAPKMGVKGIIVVHDYQNEALPGARKAVDEFLQKNGNYKLRVQSGIAIVKLKI